MSLRLTEIELGELQNRFSTKNVKLEYEKAQDWLLAKGKRYKDYTAFFRNWLRNSQDTRVSRSENTVDKLRSKELSPEQREKSLKILAGMREKLNQNLRS
jgi:hypothetical protein